MTEVVKTLQRLILYKEDGVIKVRANYEKAIEAENMEVYASLDVTDLIPNWGLDAKWDQVQGIIEAQG